VEIRRNLNFVVHLEVSFARLTRQLRAMLAGSQSVTENRTVESEVEFIVWPARNQTFPNQTGIHKERHDTLILVRRHDEGDKAVQPSIAAGISEQHLFKDKIKAVLPGVNATSAAAHKQVLHEGVFGYIRKIAAVV